MFVNITDPVGQRFVASLARPGGNITGFSNYDPLMVTKWLAMLTQLTPPVARVAVLYNPATAPYAPSIAAQYRGSGSSPRGGGASRAG